MRLSRDKSFDKVFLHLNELEVVNVINIEAREWSLNYMILDLHQNDHEYKKMIEGVHAFCWAPMPKRN